jgi:hypothetical protein
MQMNQKKNKEYPLVGIGLIFGASIGYGTGLIIVDALYAPLFAGFGAGVGIILGAIIERVKTKQKKSLHKNANSAT